MNLRAPCPCGGLEGTVTPTNGQQVVRCSACARYLYCDPKASGEKPRCVQTRADLKPSRRAAILARDSFRCCVCGRGAARGSVLHVGHVLSIDDGIRLGATDAELNDDENLVTLCEECNLGIGRRSLSPRLALLLIRAAAAVRGAA